MRMTTHKNDEGDYVLRIVDEDGSYSSLGSLNGEAEADLVRDVMQGALELHHATEIMKREEPSSTGDISFVRGMKNADNMVEGKSIIKYQKGF